MDIEKTIEAIATGKRKRVTANRDLLPEIIEKMEVKYNGTCTWFGFGQTVHITRDKKEPMELKQ
jgi:hypothetical protein